jgi:hypothetical protein
VTVVVPNVAAVPEFLATIAYEPLWPTTKSPVCVFVTERAGIVTVVKSLALPLFGAPPPDELAVLVTLGAAAAPTPTTSEIGWPMPDAAITVELVHVTAAPTAEQVQPVPVALTNVRPVGKLSIIV